VSGVADSRAPILVVDDNAGKRLSIVSVLEPLGQTIVEVESGKAALGAVMDRNFAVILMDVQMPGMDGYETARFIRLRQESEHTPIIFVTAHAAEEAQIPTAYQSGAVDFIFAPIVPDILRAKATVFVELFLKSRALERSAGKFRDSEARTRSVLENVADGIVTISADGIIESFNRAAVEMFGYSEQEAIGLRFSKMVSPKHPDDFAVHDEATLQFESSESKEARSADSVGHRSDGSKFPMELDLSEVEVATGTIHIACVRDISARRSYTAALQHQALHDNLTRLPNRVLFADRVTHAIRTGRRAGESLALLIMDLNEFKHINDRFGHQHGDEVLKLVTSRVLACLRATDTVARLGGDEFGILCESTDLAAAATVVWKIQRAFEPPFVINGHAVDVTACIGIALGPTHGDNVDDLLRRADLAMYDAKRAGRGYALFATEQEEAPARRLELLGDLRRCIDRDELVLHYQPKVDLATQETVGVEALVRWNHPSGRQIPPDEFMPEVERSELMIPLTEWVINASLHQLNAWREDGFDLALSVNVGARCLAPGTSIFETTDELTKTLGIPPDKLTFEFTERALIDSSVPGIMERLEKMEERLSIDDFGTGYSSLVYLQRLPVVEIKADRSFVMTMATVKEDAVIVQSIIDLAHNLGLKVVAEGVEDVETMNLLSEYRCDEAQGYYFSRPMPAEDVTPWLETSPVGLTRRLLVSGPVAA
jgi:diguanylate cyclase (GGDEF)-like protein/PAS domain S-box-containing protein